MSNGKRFLAYEIVRRLRDLKRNDVLEKLQSKVTPSDKQVDKLHQVFKPSFDGRLIYSRQMLLQKLHYMHVNPVRKDWKLADDYLDYVHSSARFYELGEVGKCRIVNFLEA